MDFPPTPFGSESRKAFAHTARALWRGSIPGAGVLLETSGSESRKAFAHTASALWARLRPWSRSVQRGGRIVAVDQEEEGRREQQEETRRRVAMLRSIELNTRRVVNDVLAGQYHSVFKGRGIEFDQVRLYTPRRRHPRHRLERHRPSQRALRPPVPRRARADRHALGRWLGLARLRHARPHQA